MPKDDTKKILPQSIEAEKGVLGSILIDGESIIKVNDVLFPEDFYKISHQKIYQAMTDLVDRNQTIDILTVSQRLKEKGELEEIGGRSYLAQLLNSVVNPNSLLNYAKIVKAKKTLRNLIQVSDDINKLAYSEIEDIELILDEAEKKIFSVAQGSFSQEFSAVKDFLEDAFDRIDKLSSQKGVLRGVTTGLPSLDNKLGGLQKADLILLAARPSLGKSAFALDIARAVALKEKKTVGIFSLEMSKDQIIDRLIAAESGVSLWRLRTGQLSDQGEPNDFEKIQNALNKLSQAPIFIDDAPFATVLQMRAMARRLQARHNLDLIIVDYLQLIQPRNIHESTVQQVTEISRSLKGLARELNVPVLALSQLSRAVEQRPSQIPKLSDLRESGSLEQDSDVVMFINRKKDPESQNMAEIIIAKHRNGPLGKVDLYFDQETVSFREREKFYDEKDILIEDEIGEEEIF
ncbi:MAG: replicative DNA helicase [Candidatus Pacebacteria bacterium]|nr:replicative DNA helicase [Candidatus Paceibacterota bacterium]